MLPGPARPDRVFRNVAQRPGDSRALPESEARIARAHVCEEFIGELRDGPPEGRPCARGGDGAFPRGARAAIGPHRIAREVRDDYGRPAAEPAGGPVRFHRDAGACIQCGCTVVELLTVLPNVRSVPETDCDVRF